MQNPISGKLQQLTIQHFDLEKVPRQIQTPRNLKQLHIHRINDAKVTVLRPATAPMPQSEAKKSQASKQQAKPRPQTVHRKRQCIDPTVEIMEKISYHLKLGSAKLQKEHQNYAS
jgi:hypothetical protein